MVCGGSPLPKSVDRVGDDGPKLEACFLRLLLQRLEARHRVKRRVVPDRSAFRGIGREVGADLRLGEKLDGVERRINLRFSLERVAAVDDERGFVFQDHCQARRAREPGEPCEPIPVRGHGLVLEGVCLWNDEPVEAERPDRSSQGGEAA